MPPPGLTIQDFIQAIAREVSAKVAAAPPKMYDVKRSMPGAPPVMQQVSLPQVIAELTDVLKIVVSQQTLLSQQNAELLRQFQQHSNVATALIGELEATRKVWRKKRRRAEDDDEDED